MSKRTITRWYIGAWIVWIASVIALIVLARAEHPATQPTPGIAFIYGAMLGAAFLMFVMWVVALVKLARRHATFSFVVILVLQLLGIGIVGMVMYAMSTPDDVADYAVRPRVT